MSPIPIAEAGLPRAIERLRAQVHWLRHGKLFDRCPMLAVDDMEALLAALTGRAGTQRELSPSGYAFKCPAPFGREPTEEELRAAAHALTVRADKVACAARQLADDEEAR